MKPRPLVLVGILAGISASMAAGICIGVAGSRVWLEPPAADEQAEIFARILHEIEEHYVAAVPGDELLHNALRGMLNHLDKHSAYLDSAAWDDLQSETTGEFSGVGIELGLVDDQFTIMAPMAGTPAEDAGLQPGDQVLELDHAALAGLELPDVAERLRGDPGTVVHLRVRRAAKAEPWDVELVRRLIEVDSVTSRLLEPGFGYIRIAQFQIQTGDEFTAALQALINESGGSLQGLVLDLRNNPGGVLQASVAVADALLSDGLIVYTEGRQPSSNLKFRAARDDLLDGAPVAVLINGGSASAAEVVAGALQDHGRAVLIGSRSYGKGSVQSVLPVTDRDAIKLTTAFYFTPNGRNIHGSGITPDVERTPAPEASAGAADEQLLSDALTVLKQNGEHLHARL